MPLSTHPKFQLVCNGVVPSDNYLIAHFPEVFDFLEAWNDSSDFIVQRTSGSTGVPKEIQVSKRVMWHSAGATISALRIPEGAKALLAMSAGYIAGKMMIVRAMRGGWTLDLQTPSTTILDAISSNYDFAALVPMQVLGRENGLKYIAKTILGGAPVSSELAEAIKSTSAEVYETYGMTETVSHIALKQISPQAQKAFTAVNGVTFSSKDSKLVIHAKDWGWPELETTDVVELHSSTSFTWKGRADFVINSGGVKIHPEEVEPLLSELVGTQVYVTSEPDEKLGNRLVAVVEGEPVHTPSKEQLLNAGLTNFQVPKSWKTISSFPRTENGKIQRSRL